MFVLPCCKNEEVTGREKTVTAYQQLGSTTVNTEVTNKLHPGPPMEPINGQWKQNLDLNPGANRRSCKEIGITTNTTVVTDREEGKGPISRLEYRLENLASSYQYR